MTARPMCPVPITPTVMVRSSRQQAFKRVVVHLHAPDGGLALAQRHEHEHDGELRHAAGLGGVAHADAGCLHGGQVYVVEALRSGLMAQRTPSCCRRATMSAVSRLVGDDDGPVPCERIDVLRVRGSATVHPVAIRHAEAAQKKRPADRGEVHRA